MSAIAARRPRTRRARGLRRALGCLALGLAAQSAPAESEVAQPVTGFAWSESSGWVDFAPTGGGVIAHDDHLSGFAWAENLGWIAFGADGEGPYANTGASDWGVNRAAGGALSGYAWSETSGWIRFDPSFATVTVTPETGTFDGYAWSERIGWIHFRHADPAYGPTLAVMTAGPAVEVPALGEQGLAALALGLATLGLFWVKRIG